ncbi:MAG: bifunctional phosphoglucose/phosphomannose isomerase, partial [Rhodothermales bacterium]|nr:bifunctional phosphoglucose/phosphomannose isomerase [Rhodothermales bacterium]
QDMFGAIRAFPDHFRDGWVRAADFQPEIRLQDADQVVIVGMGGSAIGGDLVRTYCRDTAPVPISVVRDYTLPASVGERSIVVASSYSGGTEETLSSFEEALRRDATVYAVTSGGTLQARVEAEGLKAVSIPGGMQPRAALGYSFSVLLRMADKLGLCSVSDAEYEEASQILDGNAAVYADPSGNAARDLAEDLWGQLPVVYRGPGLLEAVGMRWQTQLHENAKQLAYGNVFAELNHNEIMAWEATPEEIRERVAVVVLRDRGDHAQVQRRMEVTRGLVEDRIGGWTEVQSQGERPLARMLSTIQLGDFVSFYLGMLAGVDPTPVDTIQELKKTLAG